MKKEEWNCSSEKANALKISDFGSYNEVKIMAHMDRMPESYTQARAILSSFIGKVMVSRSGLKATISKNSIEKILSGTSKDASRDLKSHLLAAGNLDKLFSNAIEPWEFMLNPNKNNEGIKNVHRLFAPMEYNENICIVKITVKEMVNPADGNRVYSIQTLDVFLKE